MKKTVSIAMLILIWLSGCMFAKLNEDVKKLNEAVSISGLVHVNQTSGFPIIVTLSRADVKGHPLIAYAVVYGEGRFSLSVPYGEYYLVAFEDKNHDFILQNNERVGWHGNPTKIRAKAGAVYSDFKIDLRAPEIAKKDLPALFKIDKPRQPVNLDNKRLGEVVDITAFTAELGSAGMWNPVKFHLDGHSGIYFLEPFDEKKIPVLFVHGMSGSGFDWRYLIDRLDRNKFQPWIFQYPSGIRLGSISKGLSQAINELRARYEIKDMAIVALSMGGLVSRGAINDQVLNSGGTSVVSLFVTLSTPWLGHNAASSGTKYAPVAVPSWFDMAVQSPYLTSIHSQQLPENLSYYLLFSHKGGGGLLNRENTDGSVSLGSQLSMEAQEEARKVIGYDEDHVSILHSNTVAKKINTLLQRNKQ